VSALVPRADFPALGRLTYLNTASVGLIPLPVQERAEEFERDVALRGSAALDEEAEIAVFENTRAAAARLIGAQPEEIAITASATLALGQIAWFLRPGRGENVVSVDLEFPSSTYPWLRIAEETGAEVRLVQRRDQPAGLAVADVRPELLGDFRPPIVGWRSAVVPYALDAVELRLPPSARKLEFSTSGYGAGVALGAAIEYVLAIGIERVLAHDLALAKRLRDGLEELGAEILTPREDDRRVGIVTARFPGNDGEAVAARLNEAGIVVSPRFGSTRFSVHLFNDESDVDRGLDVTAAVLAD
jgi:selenocysteine lyase/cysteine desulfurase